MTISREQQLEILRKMTDDDIDFSDIPEITEEKVRMGFYVPQRKHAVTVRIDEDVLEWLRRSQPKGYQTLINAVLRKYYITHRESTTPEQKD
jgi:uncharacterized protein (DUF4415 family)